MCKKSHILSSFQDEDNIGLTIFGSCEFVISHYELYFISKYFMSFSLEVNILQNIVILIYRCTLGLSNSRQVVGQI
jgi:hypothetical protein